jgi:hypothetical protein
LAATPLLILIPPPKLFGNRQQGLPRLRSLASSLASDAKAGLQLRAIGRCRVLPLASPPAPRLGQELGLDQQARVLRPHSTALVQENSAASRLHVEFRLAVEPLTLKVNTAAMPLTRIRSAFARRLSPLRCDRTRRRRRFRNSVGCQSCFRCALRAALPLVVLRRDPRLARMLAARMSPDELLWGEHGPMPTLVGQVIALPDRHVGRAPPLTLHAAFERQVRARTG